MPLRESQQRAALNRSEDGLVGVAEAARILAVSVSTLYAGLAKKNRVRQDGPSPSL